MRREDKIRVRRDDKIRVRRDDKLRVRREDKLRVRWDSVEQRSVKEKKEGSQNIFLLNYFNILFSLLSSVFPYRTYLYI